MERRDRRWVGERKKRLSILWCCSLPNRIKVKKTMETKRIISTWRQLFPKVYPERQNKTALTKKTPLYKPCTHHNILKTNTIIKSISLNHTKTAHCSLQKSHSKMMTLAHFKTTLMKNERTIISSYLIAPSRILGWKGPQSEWRQQPWNKCHRQYCSLRPHKGRQAHLTLSVVLFKLTKQILLRKTPPLWMMQNSYSSRKRLV